MPLAEILAAKSEAQDENTQVPESLLRLRVRRLDAEGLSFHISKQLQINNVESTSLAVGFALVPFESGLTNARSQPNASADDIKPQSQQNSWSRTQPEFVLLVAVPLARDGSGFRHSETLKP